MPLTESSIASRVGLRLFLGLHACRLAIALAVTFALALLLRVPVADIPLERDEGEYAYLAQRWLQGEVPYLKSFDQKPPGVFAAYALTLSTLGETPAAIHWGAQIYTLGTLTVLLLLGWKLFSFQVGFLAATVCAFLTIEPGVLGNAANTELFMILPITSGLLATVLAIERNSITCSLMAGTLGAVGLFFKQVALVNLVFCLILVAWKSPRRLWLTGAMITGALAIVVLVCSYFMISGAWHEFYDCVIGYNLSYGSMVPKSSYLSNFLGSFGKILISCWPFYLLATIGFACCFTARFPERLRPAKQSASLIASWLLCSFAGVAVGGIFRPHYFFQIIPAISLFAGLGASAGSGLFPLGRFGRGFPYFFCAVGMVIAITQSLWYFGAESPAKKARRLYELNPFPEALAVGQFLATNSDPAGSVFIFGSEPEILFYAVRKSASRFIYVYPLVTDFPDTLSRQKIMFEEIESARPDYVVSIYVPTSFLPSLQSGPAFFNEVDQFLNQSYRVVGFVPFTSECPSPLITGTMAKDLWQKMPMTYKNPGRWWCSIVIWQRT